MGMLLVLQRYEWSEQNCLSQDDRKHAKMFHSSTRMKECMYVQTMEESSINKWHVFSTIEKLNINLGKMLVLCNLWNGT